MRIAVTGAGGRIGSQVVRLIASTTAHEVVAVTRRQPPDDGHNAQVLFRRADYTDMDALRTALRDIDTLVFVSSDGPVAQVVVHHHNLIRAATETGVGHIVALSGLDVDVDSPFCYAVSYSYTERLLCDSGCPTSVARASIYTEFFGAFLTRARADGRLRLPAANGRVSFVSRADVARCLARLATAPATNRHHDITGPESLDLATLAAIAEQEWNAPLRYTPLNSADFGTDLALAGEDPWWIYAYSSMFASVREGRWAAVSDEVERLTGLPPASAREVFAQPLFHS